MPTERELTLEQMREYRSVSEAVFIKFTEAREYFGTHAFCFYEGEDGKYYDPRVSKYWGEDFIPIVAGNKKEVLKAMRKIKADPLYADVCTMFFIDRDYDESLADTNDDLFETPCYSIENLYAQEIVFRRILQSEFGLSNIDMDHQKCLSDYRLRLAEFNRIIAKFNAVVKYQHMFSPETKCQFSAVKTSHLAHVEIEQVSKSINHDEKINSLTVKLNVDAELLETLENELLEESEPQLVFRGKNQLDFLVSIVKKLKALNSSGEYFSATLKNVHITITDNRLSELSQYAITPPELDSFLERHRPQISS